MNTLQTGLVVWFTGLSSAGKTTLAVATQRELQKTGLDVELLDGDIVRRTLSRDLSFTKNDREENIRRISFIAAMLERHGVIVLVAATSPFRQGRDDARAACRNFVEVYVNAPLAVCEQRDLKGIYRKARTGQLMDVIGVHEPYEVPLPADVECRTHEETVSTSLLKILDAINNRLCHSSFLFKRRELTEANGSADDGHRILKPANLEAPASDIRIWCDHCSVRIAQGEARTVIQDRAYHQHCYLKLFAGNDEHHSSKVG